MTRWFDIDSPSGAFTGTPRRPRPWWHHVVDDVLLGLEGGLLRAAPWICIGVAATVTYWLLTR